jgi:uncharacterized protein (TIGR02284 family)
MMRVAEATVACLNSLLQSETAAAEAYEQACPRGVDPAVAAPLGRIAQDHQEAVTSLRQHIHYFGGTPDGHSGTAGTFAPTGEAAQKPGNAAVLRAFKEAEEAKVDAYERALQDEDLAEESKMLIRATLLPQTRSHLRVLGGLLG